MSRGIIIIGSCKTSRSEIIEAASRAMKTEHGVTLAIHHLSSCTNIHFEEVEESSKIIKDAFAFSGIAAEKLKDSLDEFFEAINDYKQKQSFDLQPSKYISKPKNNYRTR